MLPAPLTPRTDLHYATKILIAYSIGLRIQYHSYHHKAWLDYSDKTTLFHHDLCDINDPTLVRVHPEDAARMHGVLIGLTPSEINTIARACNVGDFKLSIPKSQAKVLVGSPNLAEEANAIIKSIVDVIHPLNTL